ncbi:hypothetical protein BDW42DRAFT_172859 [Aspergillus taichungensis]|uniref:Uncharacterized protein n=1 Tax=Aspergillus taichungensis TaxID=482145 RepID=A0A2J5HQB7_9EURO|nr:hypothetical protein BDW42DRAFT_172859 [Aspergillus taichungensis]
MATQTTTQTEPHLEEYVHLPESKQPRKHQSCIHQTIVNNHMQWTTSNSPQSTSPSTTPQAANNTSPRSSSKPRTKSASST